MLLGLFMFVPLGNVARVNKRKVMTKVSVLGQANEEKIELKKIELVKYITSKGSGIDEASLPASNFGEVILIQTNAFETGGFDLILAKSHNPDINDTIYLGHWNDGIV